MLIKPFLLVAACSLIAWQGIAQNPQNGAYFLRSALGRHLDVQWGNANAGAPMHLWDFNGGVAQKWQLQKTPQGFYTIQAFSTSGGGRGDGFFFAEEIRLSPDEQAVTVLAGGGCSGGV